MERSNNNGQLVAKAVLVLAFLGSVLVVFSIAYVHYRAIDRVKSHSQQQSDQIVSLLVNSIAEEVDLLERTAWWLASHPAFAKESDRSQDAYRFTRMRTKAVEDLLRRQFGDAARYPGSIGGSNALAPLDQVARGLPLRSDHGARLAQGRRAIASSVLKRFPSIDAIGEIDSSGKVVFLTPFQAQLSLASSHVVAGADVRRLAENGRRGGFVPSRVIGAGDQSGEVLNFVAPIDGLDRALLLRVHRDRFLARISEKLGAARSQRDVTFEMTVADGLTVASGSPFSERVSVPQSGVLGYLQRAFWSPSGLIFQPRLPERPEIRVRVRTPFPPVETAMSRLYFQNALIALGIVWAAGYTIWTVLTKALERQRRIVAEIDRERCLGDRAIEGLIHDFRNVSHEIAYVGSVLGDLILTNGRSQAPKLQRLRSSVEALGAKFHGLTHDLSVLHSNTQSGPRVINVARSLRSLISEGPAPDVLDTSITIQGDDDELLFAAIAENQFRRVVENLVTNSREACGRVGRLPRIGVSACIDDRWVVITVRDNGPGISADVLPRLFDGGASVKTSKDGRPHGFGLRTCKELIENHGGRIAVLKSDNQGTVIETRLVRQGKPSWFVDEIELTGDREFVIVDDQGSVAEDWKHIVGEAIANRRVSGHRIEPRYVCLRGGSELRKYLERHTDMDSPAGRGQQSTIFLIDYDLGESETGIDLIRKLGLGQEYTILVTNFPESEDVVVGVNELGVGLLPKVHMGSVRFPIRLGTLQ